MYALVKLRESFRALRHSKRWEYRRANLWDLVSGSSLTGVHTALPPLNSKRAEIRLMHLLPGAYDDQLECKLEVVSLNDDPDYEALSYCWSRTEVPEESPTCDFRINDTIVQTLPNLSHALRHLRDPKLPRKLWVDYVCINQYDTQERNAQVQLMGSIYHKARRVVCWLGEEDPETSSAIQLLVALVNKKTHFGEFFAGETDDSINSRGEPLQKLLLRPWFYRIWTVQEVALCKDAILVCGNQSVPWSIIRDANDFFQQHWHCCIYFVQLHEGIGNLTNPLSMAARRLILDEEKLSICDVLVRFMDNRASDVRDHVYGLLGLLNSSEHNIKADYDLPTSAVFRRTAVEIMRHEHTIDYLARLFATEPNPEEGMTELPSWVADFSNLSHNSHGITPTLFNACGSYDKAHFHVVNEETVSYRGILVDKVAFIDEGADLAFGVNTVAEAQALLLKLEHIENMVESRKQSISYSQASAVPAANTSAQAETGGVSETVSDNASTAQTDSSTVDYTASSRPLDAESKESIGPIGASSQAFSPVLSALYRTLSAGWVNNSVEARRRLNADDDPTYKTARDALSSYAASPTGTPSSEFYAALSTSNVFQWALRFTTTVSVTRFFITATGFMGVGHQNTRVGDQVVVFQGGRVPFLLRPQGERPGWTEKRQVHTFLGSVYVDGIMDGEAVERATGSDWKSMFGMRDESSSKIGKEWRDIHMI